jgi:hypothetical protein
MASFQTRYEHQQTPAAASQKLRKFSEVISRDLPTGISDVSESWNSDGSLNFEFKAMGMPLAGTMTVHDDHVLVKGTMPFAALPFRGAIESQIRSQLETALG